MRFKEDSSGNLLIDIEHPERFKRFLDLPKLRPRRSLYKFSRISENLINTLTEAYLWYSRPNDFNDPFDCKMVINYNLDRTTIKKYVSIIDHGSNDQSEVKRLVVNSESEYSYLDKYYVNFQKLIASGDTHALNKILSAAKFAERSKTTDQLMGVCCFTADPTNLLMWAHYGAQHTGICLEFRHRGSKTGFQHTCFPVLYRKRIPIFVWKQQDLRHEARILLKGVLIKSVHWQYEREWRSVVLGKFGKQSFEKQDLTSVIFGVNATRKDIKKVTEILSEYGYNQTSVKLAKPHLYSYRISIVDYHGK